MKKKFMTVALCGLLAFAASGFAAAAEENKTAAAEEAVAQAEMQNEKESQEITLRVAITGHEAGRIYKVTDEEGNVLRADLGKHGGRMLNRHPFMLTAEVAQDEQGEVLKLKKVEYVDPAPLIEKQPEKQGQQVKEETHKADDYRDHAYGHDLSKSHQKRFYQYNMANLSEADLASYKKVDVAAIAKEEAGTKVAFVGSAVRTVEKDKVIRFWGGPVKGGHVEVIMNDAYVPLGQRSTVYGTVQEGGRVSLKRLDSVE
ncbi:MAG: hypothetical protein Q4E64_05625 [Phascolarctobacterium sp.]|uniref:hypothetical protein n=1 Tax=Phascolarctobacterium sp. TaxID=2049039 RepID=UPI0026DCC421|nr:hypothetical protein [Phascolarctobacterium sp.]MDO4921287.1 hypothetical protein [Phascolarctobacterium sp.]